MYFKHACKGCRRCGRTWTGLSRAGPPDLRNDRPAQARPDHSQESSTRSRQDTRLVQAHAGRSLPLILASPLCPWSPGNHISADHHRRKRCAACKSFTIGYRRVAWHARAHLVFGISDLPSFNIRIDLRLYRRTALPLLALHFVVRHSAETGAAAGLGGRAWSAGAGILWDRRGWTHVGQPAATGEIQGRYLRHAIAGGNDDCPGW